MRRIIALTATVAIVVTVAVGPASGRSGSSVGLQNDRHIRSIEQRLFAKQHRDRFGGLSITELLGGIRQFQRLPVSVTWRRGPVRASSLLAPSSVAIANPVIGSEWQQIGPAPLQIDPGGGSCDGGALNCNNDYQGLGPDSGMVTDIAIDPRNTTDRTIYIAANDGGVWKSTDGGSTWAPKTDNQVSLSTGAIVLDPSNPSIVYAGTGAQPVATNGFVKGAGILRSTDGGATWTTVGASLFTGAQINRMVMPAANVLLAASSKGLYRSVDGGQHFGNNSPNFDNTQPVLGAGSLISDLHLDTANANTVYAAVQNGGLYESTDGGATFPTNLFSNPGAPAGTLGYISFAQSTNPNNQEIVASVQGGTYGFYRSTNAGGNWSGPIATASTAAAQNNGCQCGYDQTVGIDPQDANQVYIGFQELYKSSDGGQTFNTTAVTHGQTHWDHHAITFSPSTHWGGSGAPTTMYVGEDGGFAQSTDGGGTWANLNAGIATNLFRAIDIGRGSSANNDYSYGGMQDTGTAERRAGFSGNDWHLGIDGDGGAVAVDPSDPQRVYGQDDGGYIITTNGGNSWDFSTPHGLPSAFRFAIDPNTPANVFATTATNSGFNPGTTLYESTDSGNNYSAIHTFTSAVWALANTPTDSNTMWVGLANGTVQYTTNLLSGSSSTWTPITIPGSPGQFVSGIAIDPTDTNRVVVTYTGFFGNNPTNLRTKHVFLTTDGGTNWVDASGTDGGSQNLPDLPVNSVVLDPGTTPPSIIAANDAGVVRSVDNGGTWQRLGLGMPLVDATWLALDTSVTPPILRVGTYGRSAFDLGTPSGPALAVNADLSFGPVPVGRTASRIVQLFNVGSADLHVVAFSRVAGSSDFSVVSGPPTPVTILPGHEIDYTVQFAPTSAGDKIATFRVQSDDPNQPNFDIPASGTGVTGEVALAANALEFGGVPVDDRTAPHESSIALRISNQASCQFCDLTVNSLPITGPNASDFSLVGAPSLPATIGAGNHLDITVKFNPSADGARSATLTVNTSDPTDPSLPVSLSGTGLLSNIGVVPDPIIFGPTVFDPQCGASCGQAQNATVTNTGQAELIVDGIAFSNPVFSGPPATAPPQRVAPNASFIEPVTFHPTGSAAYAVTGTMSITHNVTGTITVQKVVPLCGESVGRGIRVLALDPGGTPYSSVDRITLQSFGVKSKVNVDSRNNPLVTIVPPTSCQTLRFHYQNQSLPATDSANQKGSYYSLKVTQGNKSTSVTFVLGANEFKTIVVRVG
jgi:photosystem II stability/assembly factor-like uncharacterized protein